MIKKLVRFLKEEEGQDFAEYALTLRRMDEAGSVVNPTYRRSWNWGGTIYWAVREGQGQIGWPGR